ncbi:MAG: SGNH/GDSL hydrolase family protein [Deltaproteobacteria bacterium]|nr:SGNH/GDSL hydrolase family protein [Deltaproteobacteria bacterium]
MRTRKLLFYGVMVLLPVFLVEGSLQIINFIIPNGILSDIDPSIPDKVLGHRPNPQNPDHDSNGFRNKTIPPHIDIMVLGDSQTYGTGVSRANAWPQQLAKSTGLSVYNMAFGGWGPVQSLLLLPEAMAKKPKIIIEAFYAGNDLFDSFSLVYTSKNGLDFLKTRDRQVLERIAALDLQETIDKKASKADINVAQAVKDEDILITVKSFLRNHVKIYRVISFTKKRLWDISFEDESKTWDNLKNFVKSHEQQKAVILENQNIKTILTPAYRLTVVNLDDVRISEGLDISLKTFKIMSNLCAKQGIRFYVVLIPTKESVFSVAAHGINDLNYLSLLQNERLMWKKTKNFLQANDIPYIDSQPYLQDKLLQGLQPYSLNDDGHPNNYGCQAIAEGVGDFFKKNPAARIGPVD